VNPSRRVFSRTAGQLFDLIALTFSYGFATALLYSNMRSTTLAEYLTYRVKIVNLFHFGLFLLVWHGIFSLCDLYVSKRLATLYSENHRSMKATTLSAVFLLAAGNVFRLYTITGAILDDLLGDGHPADLGEPRRDSAVLRMLRARGKNTRVMLILGTNRRAIEFAKRIQSRPELGYQILGFVDDGWDGLQAFHQHGQTRSVVIWRGFGTSCAIMLWTKWPFFVPLAVFSTNTHPRLWRFASSMAF